MVPVERLPVSIVFPWWLIVTLFASKCATHPWSHSWPTERRELFLRAGNMWGMVAPIGIYGFIGRMAVWVLVMVLPSGRLTDIPCVTGVMYFRLPCACR
jgi:hypothetical protein